MNNDFGGQTVIPDYEVNKDDKMFGMLSHLLAIFCCIIGPLVIWLMKKDKSRFVNDNAKQAMGFYVVALIVTIGLVVVSIVLTMISPKLGQLFSLLQSAIGLVFLAYFVLGTIRANEGKIYKYPISSKFVK